MSQVQSNAQHDSKSLWIGDIEPWMDEEYVKSLFANQSDHIISVKLKRDKATGQPQGYGFIEFTSHDIAERVLNMYMGTVVPSTGKPYKVNWAVHGAGGVAGTKPQGNQNMMKNQYQQGNQQNSIYVGDLDPSVDDQQLREFFEQQYSTITSAKVIADPATKVSKGYGFVTFASFDEAQRSITEMQGAMLNSRPIKTKQAVSKKSNENSYQSGQYNSQQNMSYNPYGQGMPTNSVPAYQGGSYGTPNQMYGAQSGGSQTYSNQQSYTPTQSYSTSYQQGYGSGYQQPANSQSGYQQSYMGYQQNNPSPYSMDYGMGQYNQSSGQSGPAQVPAYNESPYQSGTPGYQNQGVQQQSTQQQYKNQNTYGSYPYQQQAQPQSGQPSQQQSAQSSQQKQPSGQTTYDSGSNYSGYSQGNNAYQPQNVASNPGQQQSGYGGQNLSQQAQLQGQIVKPPVYQQQQPGQSSQQQSHIVLPRYQIANVEQKDIQNKGIGSSTNDKGKEKVSKRTDYGF